MIKAIIFDCWNTLFYTDINPHPFSIFAERIGKSIYDYEFLKVFEKHFMLKKHYDIEVPMKGLLNELNIKFSKELINDLKDIYQKTFDSQKAYPETLKVLNELKSNYKLGLITNTEYQGVEMLEEKFNISRIFNIILKSYETGILKPDSKVFEIMLKRLNVKKNEAIMVGDNLKDDVEAAEKVGIKGILIDRKNKHLDYKDRINSLEQLNKFL